MEYRGRTALITGASWGIGTAFAHALATRGMNLILVARSRDRLDELSRSITENTNVRAEVISADLSEEGVVDAVRREVEQRGLAVDILVNNAGFATHGHFETISAEREHDEIMVNVASVVGMTHAFVPGMLQRGGGAVINVASTAAFQPLPFMAVYAATKAFVVSFSLALAEEYRGRNVRVLTLCPGPTDTNFFEASNAAQAKVGRLRSADQVVATGLRALDRGRSFVVDGTLNAISGFLARKLPATFTARMAGKITRPRPSGQS
jgi:short-subunit dehydrogenase